MIRCGSRIHTDTRCALPPLLWFRPLFLPVSSSIVISRARLLALSLVICVLYGSLFVYFSRSGPDHSRSITETPESQMRFSAVVPSSASAAACPLCEECAPAEPPPACEPPPPPTTPSPPPVAPAVVVESRTSMATTEVTELFRNVANPSDTVGTVHHIQGRGSTSRRGDTYKLCSFTNVCASNDKLFFAHHDQGQVAKWKEEWNEKCWKVAHWLQPPICNCFHPGFLPDFLTPDQLALDRTLTHQSEFTHTWGVHKWVWEHHIAHWAQKLIIWQSTYQHAPFDNLPPIDSILFHDSDPPLSDHETVIFDAVLSALQPPRTHPIAQMRGAEREKWTVWAQTLRDKKSAAESTLAAQLSSGQAPTLDPSHLTCFERLSFSPFYGMFSTHPDDTANFRNAVYAHFGLPLATRCPPRRAVLLYRNNRVIVNRDELRAMLKKEYDLEVEYVTIDEKSTSEEQVTLFATTGLLLSSHSSQMINVLFSPPGSAMVEIAPEFYNADFSEYAHGMGIFFQYALGGSVPDGTAQPLQAECVSHLSSCEGASHCILAERHLCQNKEYPNKNLNFVANLTAVSIAVKNSLAHLNWLCTGRW